MSLLHISVNSEYCRSNDARKKKTFFIYKKHLSFLFVITIILFVITIIL